MATSASRAPKQRLVTCLEDMFERSIPIPESGCWAWDRAVTSHGYGAQSLGRGRTAPAHRLAYEFAKGPIPEGLELDHLCRVRSCINPDHLEAVTHEVNVRRGEAGGRFKTHCLRGHPMSGDNLRIGPTQRHCRACCSLYFKNYRKAKRSCQ